MVGEVGRATRPTHVFSPICAVLIAALACSSAAAQRSGNGSTQARSPDDAENTDEILIIGQRPTVAGMNPIATFDRNAIAAMGATSMGDLMRVIRPVARSIDNAR